MKIDHKLKSSEVVGRALGFEPAGVPAEKPGVCAMCGAEIKKGDLCGPLQLGPGFMDSLSLASRGSQLVCGWCIPSLAVEGLRASGYGAFSLQEAKPFRKWDDIASVLIDPPQPPFVLVQATANNQHMAWRAPVNWSREMFYVRVGLRDVKIRRKYLLDALQSSIRLGQAIFDAGEKKGKKKNSARVMAPHPFIGLSRDLKDNSEVHGRLTESAYAAVAENPSLQADVDCLLGLTLGESWGLLFLLVHGADTNKIKANKKLKESKGE